MEGGGAGREVRLLMLSWWSEEYHHSRNCRKKVPKERAVERETATPPATPTTAWTNLLTKHRVTTFNL